MIKPLTYLVFSENLQPKYDSTCQHNVLGSTSIWLDAARLRKALSMVRLLTNCRVCVNENATRNYSFYVYYPPFIHVLVFFMDNPTSIIIKSP
ncbi:Uncharacterized protein APZ42_020105 [Daphnia magna]|uniref:Uncharacterized protein n=1 Tax=Daphnia magna TaxID=35525 RepID=A0A164XYJ1_9CRUS|nr:Uncharacterized protein APZ42_020105 [Daphnia magna]